MIIDPYDLIIIPGYGGMLLITNQETSTIDTAFFCPDKDYINALKGDFRFLHKGTKPLFTTYSVEDRVGGSYVKDLTSFEMKEGALFLVRKRGLSTLTVPEGVYKSMLQRAIENDSTGRILERSSIIYENFKRRRGAFFNQVRRWRFRNICSKNAVRKMVEEGIFAEDTWMFVYNDIREDLQERREHLQSTIQLLERFPNCKIALVDEEEDLLTDNLWEVKGDHAVLMQTWYRDLSTGGELELDLKLTEPTVVTAFHEYFLSLWGQISPCNRDKRLVIDWLKSQLARIPHH